ATGAINTVGSDHASYSAASKDQARDNIFEAPFGMPGAPILWPSMFTWAMETGVPLPSLVRTMAETPARLFGMGGRKGTLLPGADADIIIVDPNERQVVDAEALWPSRSPSPLAGQSLAGWPQMTFSRGEIVWRAGEIVAAPGRGTFIPQERCLR